MWGISYPGFYTSAGIIDAHPALKAASPQAPIADWFIGDDFHHNGTLYLPHMFRFFSSFGHPRPEPTLPPAAGTANSALTQQDGYSFFLGLGPLSNINEKFFKNDVPFWTEMTQHANYDEFWQARDLRRHLKNIKPAVMTVGGWFDAEDLFGALNTYQGNRKEQPRRQQHAGDGSVVSRRLVAQRWRFARARAVRFQDRGVLPRRDRVPVLQSLAEGQGRSQTARGLRLRDRHQPVAQGGCLAAERCAGRRRSTSRPMAA